MKLNEMMEKLKNGGAVSEYRDERRITMHQNKGITKLRRTKGLKEKLLFIQEFAFPFNPYTGQSDEFYNDKTPFRSGLSATTVLHTILNEVAVNPELKQFWGERGGLTEAEISAWEVEASEDLVAPIEMNDVLRKVFSRYIFNREIVIPVVYINIPAITGQKFSVNYAFEVPQDEMTGEYEGDPIVIGFAKFFNSINFAKTGHIKEEIEKAKKGITPELKIQFSEKVLPDVSKLATLSEDEIKDLNREAMSDSPISTPSIKRFVLLYALPLDASTGKLSSEFKAELKGITEDGFKKYLRYTNVTKELNDNVLTVDQENYYSTLDFIEVLMKCPDNTEDPMLIGKDTRYASPEATDALYPNNSAITPQMVEQAKAITKAHNQISMAMNEEGLDMTMRKSVRLKPYDEGLEAAIISHYTKQETGIFDTPWLSEEDLKFHIPLIEKINPSLGDDIALTHDDPTSEEFKELNKKIDEVNEIIDLDGKDVVEDGDGEGTEDGAGSGEGIAEEIDI